MLSEYNVFRYAFPAQTDSRICRQQRLSISARHVPVTGAQQSVWRTNKLDFLQVWPRIFCFKRDLKINLRCYWRSLMSRKVLFKTKACLCPYMENYWWKLLRISSIQSALPRFGLSFWEPKTDNYVVCWWWHILHCQVVDSWLRKWKTISCLKKCFPPI